MNIEKIRDALQWARAFCRTIRQNRGETIDAGIVETAREIDVICHLAVDEIDDDDDGNDSNGQAQDT